MTNIHDRMSRHTPGEWKVGQQGYVGVNPDDPCNWHGICQVMGYGPEHEANAKIISAAPELLEALILLEREMVESGNAMATDFGWSSAIAKTRSAIAKATGEQK